MSTIKSKHTNKPIDVEGTFLKIREIINELEFNPGEETPFDSDELDTMVSTFGTLMDGLHFWYCEGGGDAFMPDRTFTSLTENWLRLQKIIKVRDQEYNRVCKLAMHGTESLFSNSTQNGEEK